MDPLATEAANALQQLRALSREGPAQAPAQEVHHHHYNNARFYGTGQGIRGGRYGQNFRDRIGAG